MNKQNTSNFDNATLILLAGGRGKRTGMNTPKQYLDIRGKKVIEYSLETTYPLFSNIIVIVTEIEDATFLKEKFPNIQLVKASNSRSKSLVNVIDNIDTKFVLLHDASRPFLNKEITSDIIDELHDYKCAYPVLSIKNSLVVDDDGYLQSTPDRDKYREIQTPQGFHTDTLQEALHKFGDKYIHIPETIRLLGHKVRHVEGSPWLFKITFKPDLYAAEAFIEDHLSLDDTFSDNN